MAIVLPTAINDFFCQANAGDAHAAAHCFSTEGEVLDEGKTHHGSAEIAGWLDASRQAYSAHLTPVRIEGGAESPLVHVKVEGNFSGSPIVLKFHFTLAEKFIQNLEITS